MCVCVCWGGGGCMCVGVGVCGVGVVFIVQQRAVHPSIPPIPTLLLSVPFPPLTSSLIPLLPPPSSPLLSSPPHSPSHFLPQSHCTCSLPRLSDSQHPRQVTVGIWGETGHCTLLYTSSPTANEGDEEHPLMWTTLEPSHHVITVQVS